MKTIGNLIWVIFGGLFMAMEYVIASFVLMITIIGIPFGIQTLKLGLVALWPFGTNVRESENDSGCLSTFMNVLWIITGGIWIALSHLIFGILFSITIIGIPFGRQHFKLSKLALTPFGKVID
jgi:uncharacterized membrane protein YccF (DUF307 family)